MNCLHSIGSIAPTTDRAAPKGPIRSDGSHGPSNGSVEGKGGERNTSRRRLNRVLAARRLENKCLLL